MANKTAAVFMALLVMAAISAVPLGKADHSESEEESAVTFTVSEGKSVVIDKYKTEIILRNLTSNSATVEMLYSERKTYDGYRHDPMEGSAAVSRFPREDNTHLATLVYRNHKLCSSLDFIRELWNNGKEIIELESGYSNYQCKNRYQEQCHDDGTFDRYYEEYCDFEPFTLGLGETVKIANMELSLESVTDSSATFKLEGKTINPEPAESDNLSLEITHPRNGQTVHGEVLVRAVAESSSFPPKSPITFSIISKGEIVVPSDVSCEQAGLPIVGGKHILQCSFRWDSSKFAGKEVVITASAGDSEGNKATDKIKISVQPKEEHSVLRVKAYDAKTGEPVPDATTIILLLSKNTGKEKEILAELEKEKEPQPETPEAEETEPAASVPGGAGQAVRIQALTTSRPYLSVVADTVRANGRDAAKIRPGSYYLITYAKGYSLYYYWGLDVHDGQEYNLYAPLSRAEYREMPPAPPIQGKYRPARPAAITHIIEKSAGQRVVEIRRELTDEEVEVLPAAIYNRITIKPGPTEKSRFLLVTKDIEAVTSGDIEIENKKLYIKSGNLKAQVKVLPDMASERAREAAKVHTIKDMELRIMEKKPVYVIHGSQKARLFGLIPTEYQVTAHIDGETGDISRADRPFWAFLAVPGGT
jgi:hypothetical protein